MASAIAVRTSSKLSPRIASQPKTSEIAIPTAAAIARRMPTDP